MLRKISIIYDYAGKNIEYGRIKVMYLNLLKLLLKKFVWVEKVINLKLILVMND